jgi:hypothetical protein
MKLDVGNIKLARRDFLKLSTATVAAPVMANSVVTMKPLPVVGVNRVAAAPAPRMSIGYWDGRLNSSFVDAREIGSADLSLADGVRVRVAGCCGAEDTAAWSGFRSVSLNFNLQPFHDGELRAWHFQAGPVVNISSLASFSLPVDKAAGVSGWLEYRDIDTRLAPARLPFQLGFDSRRGTSRLRSGQYVIALREPGSLLGVDWQTMRLRVVDGGNALSLQDIAGQSINQPHIVVEIDPL